MEISDSCFRFVGKSKTCMRKERYELEMSKEFMTFEFTSVGPKGSIRKRVLFQDAGRKNIYNLAFGDINADTNDFDDSVVTNNGDSEKVLATVALAVYYFSKKYPTAVIVAEGSNAARNRLYRIGISTHLEELTETFDVYGYLDDVGWCVYEKNKNYSAFFIKKKKLRNGKDS